MQNAVSSVSEVGHCHSSWVQTKGSAEELEELVVLEVTAVELACVELEAAPTKAGATTATAAATHMIAVLRNGNNRIVSLSTAFAWD